jgi:hypothetical protein
MIGVVLLRYAYYSALLGTVQISNHASALLSFAMSLPASDPASKPTAQNLAAGYISHVRPMNGVSDNMLLERVLPNVLADLKALANIIQSSVEQIEAAVTAGSLTIPSPDSTFTLDSEEPRMNPDILTAGQLMTLVRPAPLVIIDMMMQVRLNVPLAMTYC